jgi:hypothetical protein
MPLPPDYAEQALYAPDAWFVHDLIELDAEAGKVVGLVDTTRLGPLVDAQIVRPGHPKHFPGAVAVQITGTLGQIHAIYVLGLRSSDGWSGFGTHILDARFRKLGEIGPPVVATCHATRVRNLRGTRFIDYTFVFTQDDEPIYESKQRAAWVQAR